MNAHLPIGVLQVALRERVMVLLVRRVPIEFPNPACVRVPLRSQGGNVQKLRLSIGLSYQS